MSIVTKFKLSLYYAKTYSYNEFHVNIIKEGREMSKKQHFCKGL